jgi:Polyketide cyclase / dehydrase and lipid transport
MSRSRSVSQSVDVAAPASVVFDLLADPRRHADFDGSGSVQAALAAPERLELGSRFGMRMRLGLPYVISNVVVEHDEDRRIAWRHLGRHVWRYELEPLPDGGTRVTETFDWGPSLAPQVLELLRFPAKNLEGIRATLPRLKALAEAEAAAAA